MKRMLCYNKATVREGPAPRDLKEDKMDILTALLQLFGGNCAGGACAVQTAQAASAAGTATSALGGLSGLWALLCKLFGLGC